MLRLFDGLYGSLAAIQNPYRSATAHLDSKYTPDEAKYVLQMVGGFIVALSHLPDRV